MSKQQWKGSTILSPVPAVIATAGTLEQPSSITIGWTGIINSQPPKTYISIRPERHSYDIIKNSGEFTINLTTADMAFATDYIGVKSTKNEDKLKKMGLSLEAGVNVSCPSIAKSPLCLECKVFEIIKLGSHDMFMADIVSVLVEPKLLDKNGKLDMKRAGLLAYAHGEYFKLGESLGTFGFSVRKKPKQKR